jgi:hypothetical protein
MNLLSGLEGGLFWVGGFCLYWVIANIYAGGFLVWDFK